MFYTYFFEAFNFLAIFKKIYLLIDKCTTDSINIIFAIMIQNKINYNQF